MSWQTVIYVVIGLFLVQRIYLRVRRSIGWQTLSPRKMRIFTVIFCIVGLIFLAEGALSAISLISDAAGIGIGIALAYFGASLTRFEYREGRWHYRPNIWIGGVVSVLFLARLAYRISDLFTMAGQDNMQESWKQMSGGWTSGLLLIMFAYYAIYYSILLHKQKGMHAGTA